MKIILNSVRSARSTVWFATGMMTTAAEIDRAVDAVAAAVVNRCG